MTRFADADEPGVDVAVQRDGAVGAADLDPGAEAGGRSGVGDDTVLGGHDRRADRVGDVDAGVQDAPAVAEARRPDALGREDELGPDEAGLALRAVGGEGGAVGELLAVHRLAGRGLDRDDLHAVRGAADEPPLARPGGDHVVGRRLVGGVGHRVRGGGRGAGGHGQRDQAGLDGAVADLAVQAAAARSCR